MVIGIIPNISKTKIWDVVLTLIKKLDEEQMEYYIGENIRAKGFKHTSEIPEEKFLDNSKLFQVSDIIVSIGGDGTMLTTAYAARLTQTPLVGINYGKLGFLAEFDINSINDLVLSIKNKKYYIEERMALSGYCKSEKDIELYAINDIVIDRGRWPKMIELTVKADDEYVSTFSADGIIVATPTGSTGYSLSTGGPIVSPKTDVITLSPISPHTLTMRPLVLAGSQKITVTARSPHKNIQVICDGQRVHYFKPPATINIFKSDKMLKLVHTSEKNYFEILRKKLFWGLDIRANSNNNGD